MTANDSWRNAARLHEAAARGDVITIQSLLRAGVNVNVYSNETTALHAAAEKGQVAAIMVLLDAGAKINRTDGDGWTPLHRAAARNRVEAARTLLDRGAAVNVCDRINNTPLHDAASRAIVELLVSRGADVNAKNDVGMTPLHSAASEERPADVATALLDYGADPDARDSLGATALHNAVSPVIAGALIARGADVNARDKEGQTPMDTALQDRREGVAAKLRRYGGCEGEHESGHGPMPGIAAGKRNNKPRAGDPPARKPTAFVLDDDAARCKRIETQLRDYDVQWIGNERLMSLYLRDFSHVQSPGSVLLTAPMDDGNKNPTLNGYSAAAMAKRAGWPTVMYMTNMQAERKQKKLKALCPDAGCYVYPWTGDGRGFDPRALEKTLHETISRNLVRGDRGRDSGPPGQGR
ncbi:MAG: ankyrin repeat domain-containing protein [Phycisphaerae bacterium]|nr:ankyrin repeat domain-containing protein [Phycisphaerae bacterium]NUQ44825.1 ankyrin repeat domain-containing protein [Phycisphaerae bacterium]